MDITNIFNRPLVLQDGTILAAHGTAGATKTVDALHEFDNRLLLRGLLVGVEKAVEKTAEKILKEK